MEFSGKLFILVLLPIIGRCSADYLYHECSKNFTVSNNSMLQDSIKNTLSNLIERPTVYDFATLSNTTGLSTIYSLAQCRGDLSHEACSSCFLVAVNKIQTSCPLSAEAKIWYENCFIRYDSNNFIGRPAVTFSQGWFSPHLAADHASFDQAMEGLVTEVTTAAVVGDNKFGRVEKHILESNTTIYGMAQCTLDLQKSACKQCLDMISKAVFDSCKHHLGCKMLSTSCVLRYENYDFLVGSASPSPVAYAPTSP